MKHGFLISLGIALAIGWFGADWVGQIAGIPGLRSAIVFAVLLVAGMTLPMQSIRGAVKHPAASLVAVVVNLFLIPALAAIVILLVGNRFWPQNLSAGFWVAAIAPCTLASATVWTRRAGGNVAVSMLTTVVTNLACAIVIPLAVAWSPVLITSTTAIDLAAQIQKIGVLVVLPMILGGLFRQMGFANSIDARKTLTKSISQTGILIMVAFGGAASAAFPLASDPVGAPGSAITALDTSFSTNPPFSTNPTGSVTMGLVITGLILAALGVHLGGLAGGWYAARACRADRADAIAAAIAGSQKTLMVGLQIALDLGVSVLPMLIYHVVQLIIDTVVADRNIQQPLKKTAQDA